MFNFDKELLREGIIMTVINALSKTIRLMCYENRLMCYDNVSYSRSKYHLHGSTLYKKAHFNYQKNGM